MASVPQGFSGVGIESHGMLMHLSKTEARILYIRNLLLIALSLVVGFAAFFCILSSWRAAMLSFVCKYTHFMVRWSSFSLGEEVTKYLPPFPFPPRRRGYGVPCLLPFRLG